MPRVLRSKLILLLVLVLMVSTAGCAQKKTRKSKSLNRTEGPVRGGTFRYFLMEPLILDSAHVQESEGIQVAKQVYDGLVDHNPKTMEVKPAMAKSWKSNKSATVWTFKLRKGVKFHNGRECKAQDFVYSWNRVAAKETASEIAYHLAPIKGFEACQEGTAKRLEGVKARDDYTLEVTLKYPYAEFPTILGHIVFSPVPKEEVQKYGEKFGENPCGTGPFKFVEWMHDQRIVLKRNPDYYGHKPYLDRIVFKIFDDEQSGFSEFKAGNLDDCEILPGQIRMAKVIYGDRALIESMLSLYYYGFNMDADPWGNNQNLRRALNYALDRNQFAAIFGREP